MAPSPHRGLAVGPGTGRVPLGGTQVGGGHSPAQGMSWHWMPSGVQVLGGGQRSGGFGGAVRPPAPSAPPGTDHRRHSPCGQLSPRRLSLPPCRQRGGQGAGMQPRLCSSTPPHSPSPESGVGVLGGGTDTGVTHRIVGAAGAGSRLAPMRVTADSAPQLVPGCHVPWVPCVSPRGATRVSPGCCTPSCPVPSLGAVSPGMPCHLKRVCRPSPQVTLQGAQRLQRLQPQGVGGHPRRVQRRRPPAQLQLSQPSRRWLPGTQLCPAASVHSQWVGGTQPPSCSRVPVEMRRGGDTHRRWTLGDGAHACAPADHTGTPSLDQCGGT